MQLVGRAGARRRRVAGLWFRDVRAALGELVERPVEGVGGRGALGDARPGDRRQAHQLAHVAGDEAAETDPLDDPRRQGALDLAGETHVQVPADQGGEDAGHVGPSLPQRRHPNPVEPRDQVMCQLAPLTSVGDVHVRAEDQAYVGSLPRRRRAEGRERALLHEP